MLKNLASTGKAVICTIHQPSSEVFAMFDRILLMAEGRTAYLGPAGQAALDFFASQGLPCPTNYNPADYFIHTLATVPDEEAESKARSRAICDAFDSSEAGRRVQEAVVTNRLVVQQQQQPNSGGSNHKVTEEDVHQVAPKMKRSPYKAHWFAQFRAVLWRSFTNNIREPVVLKIRTTQTIVILVLTIYKTLYLFIITENL